jgi:hypothetical protein
VALTLFCDEAGHTGIDLTGRDQPFFIAAGYLVDDQMLEPCRELVQDLLARVRRERRVELPELKSSSLVGSSRGRNHMAEFLRAIERIGAVPLVVAIEKRFSLGGRFVDDFLDLEDNPRAGPEFSENREVKRGAATAIGASSESTLKAIEDALRDPTRATRRAAVDAVITDLRRRGQHALAHITEGVLLTGEGLDPPEPTELSFPDFSLANTPNPTSLHTLLVAADMYAAREEVAEVKLIHDDTRHMEAVLRHAYWISSDPVAHERMARMPYLVIPPRVERVLPPEFVQSETEPLVQAADLLAGGVAHWLKRGYRRERLDASTRLIAEATITIFADGHVPGAGAVFSDDTDWLTAISRQLDHTAMRRPLGGPVRI